jgi:hypothetical protein
MHLTRRHVPIFVAFQVQQSRGFAKCGSSCDHSLVQLDTVLDALLDQHVRSNVRIL